MDGQLASAGQGSPGDRGHYWFSALAQPAKQRLRLPDSLSDLVPVSGSAPLEQHRQVRAD